jgi:hypothetical protein
MIQIFPETFSPWQSNANLINPFFQSLCKTHHVLIASNPLIVMEVMETTSSLADTSPKHQSIIASAMPSSPFAKPLCSLEVSLHHTMMLFFNQPIFCPIPHFIAQPTWLFDTTLLLLILAKPLL